MKKTNLILSLIICISLFLGACAPTINEAILRPDDPNNVGLVTGIDNSKTAIEKYNDCVANAQKNNYIVATVQIGDEPASIFGCKAKTIDQTDLAVLPMAGVAALTPLKQDDEIIYGFIVIKEAVKFVLIASAAVAAGEAISINVAQLQAGQTIEAELLNLSTMETINIEALVSELHHTEHDVTAPHNLPLVTAMTTSFQTWVSTGGPRNRNDWNRFVCRALVIGGKVARYMLLEQVTNNLLVWTPDGTWVTFYQRSDGTVKVPENIAQKFKDAKVQTADCNSLPPFPPLGA